jgi:hypothetical protein
MFRRGVIVHQFFDDTPENVAERLRGARLRVGRIQATILDVLPQTEKDNDQWLDRRPLFRTGPIDAYVAPYRGHHMLFLRTGATNTCVRIDKISIRGEVASNPNQVCKALGIENERSGWVSYDGRVIQIRWL